MWLFLFSGADYGLAHLEQVCKLIEQIGKDIDTVISSLLTAQGVSKMQDGSLKIFFVVFF